MARLTRAPEAGEQVRPAPSEARFRAEEEEQVRMKLVLMADGALDRRPSRNELLT